jgi:hypothetical protein
MRQLSLPWAARPPSYWPGFGLPIEGGYIEPVAAEKLIADLLSGGNTTLAAAEWYWYGRTPAGE